jgi:SAM-dependent methyltransferase
MPAAVDDEGLRIGQQYVMFFAEADLMREHVVRLTAGVPDADVLEVGVGLGLFAEQLAALGVRSYTGIEPHRGAVRVARQRVLDRFPAPVTVLCQPWQLVTPPRCGFDAIMYDTWPPDGHADQDFEQFVREVAVPCLRPGGRFSFFHSGREIGDVRRDVLDRYFAGWTADPYRMLAADVPRHWTKTTRDFLIPIATKGDT